MKTIFGYVDDLGVAQFFDVDVDMSRTHRFEAVISDSPIEDGTLVTDHVVIRPEAVTLEVLVTDSPIRSSTIYPAASSIPRSQQAFLRLKELFQAKVLLDVLTPYQTYSNMVITSIELPEDQSHQGGMYASISLRQVKLAQSQATIVQARQKGKAMKRAPTAAELTKVLQAGAAAGEIILDRFKLGWAEVIEKEKSEAEEIAGFTAPEQYTEWLRKKELEELRAKVAL